jgi:biopolymer transport protein ExbD
MKRFDGPKTAHRDINVTSLIDVIFMLVVFFMIGSRFEKPALGITLPTAASGEYTADHPLIVSLDAGGKLYLEGEETDAAGLRAALVLRRNENPELKAALECDGAAAFRQVTEILDILKSAGVRNVAIRHELPRQ